jgi:hypothetical protein
MAETPAESDPTATTGEQSTTPTESALEKTIRRQLGFIADGIVRARRASNRWEIRLRNYHTVLSVVFSLLAGAGVLTTKVEKLPDVGFTTAIVSLVILIALELYRAFGVGETAQRLLAATEQFSLLEVQTRHALEEKVPLELLEAARSQAHSMEKMFHMVLTPPPANVAEAKALVDFWWTYRPNEGWQLPVSQQRARR